MRSSGASSAASSAPEFPEGSWAPSSGWPRACSRSQSSGASWDSSWRSSTAWAAVAAVGLAAVGPAEDGRAEAVSAVADSAAVAGDSAEAAPPGAGDAMTAWKRWFRHLFTDHWSVRRAFPPAALRAIEKAIGEEERRHAGQLRFAVEASLPLGELLRGVRSRERALECFGRLRVWDTEHNTGVLIYLLLADRRVEIVADRGI